MPLLKLVRDLLRGGSAPPQVKPDALPQAAQLRTQAPTFSECDEYDLVGESHYQRELECLFGPRGASGVNKRTWAVLRAEPKNQYDRNAVYCEIDGRKVGYLAREDAASFRKVMRKRQADSLRVVAVVRGGWAHQHGDGNYGVRIEVPPDTVP